MQHIRHALTERQYTWQDAVEVAKTDAEVDLDARDGQAYKPSAYEDEAGAAGDGDAYEAARRPSGVAGRGAAAHAPEAADSARGA